VVEERLRSTLCVLRVTGPGRFSFQIPGQPPFNHEGRLTVSQMYLTAEELNQVKALVLINGCELDYHELPGQTPYQTYERELLTSAFDIADVPCSECPSCPWFAPNEDPPCWADPESAYPERRNYLSGFNERYKEALEACPISGKVTEQRRK